MRTQEGVQFSSVQFSSESSDGCRVVLKKKKKKKREKPKKDMTLLALRIPIFAPQLHSRAPSGTLETLAEEKLAIYRSRLPFSFFSNDYQHLSSISLRRRHSWSIALALDTGGTPDGGTQDNLKADSGGLGQTRLGRIVGAGGKQLLEKLNAARKNFPMKVFLLLLGFYTANALATILGQTGDWDVLVAGVVVAAIEGIGMLMYKKSPSLSSGRFQSLIVMINYWKAGVCLGLFVDAFKLGS